ncbi:type I polyketide synthase [Sphingomonas sp. 37zxx]|uniref:type I polyketide synthase n=1 Tax=Sphingomonas sp. 37zxx TaxID=1550073 RepID=UPI000691A9AB|nr:type I polyketide synthase [Sphingomonas sp. 37zxx]
MTRFTCVTLTPPAAGATILGAAARAGALPLIDAVSSAADAVDTVLASLPTGTAGLRLTPGQDARDVTHLILADWGPASLGAALERLATPERSIWLEITAPDQLAYLDGNAPIAGLVARGSECGGIIGPVSAFVLTQALAAQSLPFWVQGVTGPHAAAACVMGGAAGVVIDDALLLLRESALPAGWQSRLAGLSDADTLVLGGDLGARRRVVGRADFAGAQALVALTDRVTQQAASADRADAWRAAVCESIGWGPPDVFAWPLGQASAQIALAAQRYGSTGRLIAAIRKAATDDTRALAATTMLAKGAPFAAARGTSLPLVQGPMTRVSDTASFAASVAAAGGLPLIALAMMEEPGVSALLAQTATRLAGSPWGVGLLGYIDEQLREAQFAAVIAARPPVALIAGGRPDQAARLEAAGIATFIHAPTPQLLRLYLTQGARRFVFEGAECGGHVGPLNSLPLWDAIVEVLRATRRDDVEILFAGGIHDARSAAMVAALAAPLTQQGIACGLLMGSAYLFTQEAVLDGAVVAQFQQTAVAAADTVVVEISPGHGIRCARTPFVATFAAEDARLRALGISAAQRSAALDQLVKGRLRIASKGLARDGEMLVALPPAQQHGEGLFMMGEIAGLRRDTQSCAELHHDVTANAADYAASRWGDASARKPAAPPGEPVALIGIGCLVPGAEDADGLWRMMLDGRKATRTVPAERWDWRLYDAAAPVGTGVDTIASAAGGFIDPVPFDPAGFGIPPNMLASVCMPQLLALEVTRRALADSGLDDFAHDAALRSRTAAIFGVASAGDLEQMYKLRSGLPLIAPIGDEDLARLPAWTEESFPGILLNLVAGRVANRFDLGGRNFTVDAACASSLSALDLAVSELQSGRADLALAGAIESELSPHAYVAFTKTGALSPSGEARVFSADADGIVLGEGAVVFVLKRLSDAERDGDRIYARILGVAGASDGKGLGLTAPKSAGQVRALARAHEAAGTSIGALSLYEAHGTGTQVGDRTELETLGTALAGSGVTRCIVGSAKSLTGHTRAAAGLVGVAKAALALHHRVAPGHYGINTPLAALAQGGPIQVLDAAQPWLAEQPMLAGVSAFGFGGINYHAVLGAHDSGGAPGAARWPAELVIAAGQDSAALIAALGELQAACERLSAGVSLRELALASAVAAQGGGSARLAMIVESHADVRATLAEALRRLEAGEPMPPNIVLTDMTGHADEAGAGDLAFLFPGQGAQYPGMGRELALYMPELRESIAAADPAVQSALMPAAAFDDAARAAAGTALADTAIAQPAIAAISAGMFSLATRLGLQPARVAGHSFGECTALHAAGVFDRAGLYALASARGAHMAAHAPAGGAMAMVALPVEALARYLVGHPAVELANRNAPAQQVVSGPAAAIEAFLHPIEADGITLRRLRVSSAFHSALMEPVQFPFAQALTTLPPPQPPRIPVHANRDGTPYDDRAEPIAARLVDHLREPVDFVAQIEAMWQAGTRTFVELGPGRTLTGLTGEILGNRPHAAIACDGGLRPWLRAMAQIWARGHAVDLGALHAGRGIAAVDLHRPGQASCDPVWRIDGGRAYRTGSLPCIGSAPFLTLETAGQRAPATAASPRDDALAAYQQTMQAFLDQQERLLARLLDDAPLPIEATAAASPPPPVTVSPPNAEASSTPIEALALAARIIALIGDITGYPADFIKPDVDLEAELGVNSIKRIEMIGKIVESLPTANRHPVHAAFGTLVAAKSVDELVRAITTAAATAQPAAPAPPPAACRRTVMRHADCPLPVERAVALKGLCLVAADREGMAERVIADLRRAGTTTFEIAADDLLDDHRLATRIAVLRLIHGPVRGVVHLAGFAAHQAPGDAAWRSAFAAGSTRLLALLRLLEAEVDDREHALRIVSASCMAACDGDNIRRPPAGGGPHGMLCSLMAEAPHILAKTIEIDGALPAAEIANRIAAELLVPGGGDEVAILPGRRVLFAPAPAPLVRSGSGVDWRPRSGWVVLATGGARGITAALIDELAAPGVCLVLVGRRALSEDDDIVERFRRAGARVEYRACDVANSAAFGALIDSIYVDHGRIDAVLHGAGIIADGRIANKDSATFARVFDTKVASTIALMRHLRRDGLQWAVLMGSIAGRFGNHGQADYAAANETMARLGREMRERLPDSRILTIAWGPWSGTGMASQGVQARLASQGIVPITVDQGRAFFSDEMRWGDPDCTEVIAGEGPWTAQSDGWLGPILAAATRVLRFDEGAPPLRIERAA